MSVNANFKLESKIHLLVSFQIETGNVLSDGDPTVCLLLDTAHWSDHCITVCGKWIFDSNLKLALPLTRAWLNYICSGNDTDKIEFIDIFHAIRAVPHEGVQRRLNMK